MPPNVEVSVRNPDLRDEVLAHFNEPILLDLHVARCIGYAEDEIDAYLVVRRPHPHRDTIWCTMVGGYLFLDRLRAQNAGVTPEGERWDDLTRLEALLASSGAPREAAPVIHGHLLDPEDDAA